MTYFLLKTAISAFIIAGVSEISKRSSLLGAILASLPLVSFLGMIWLYVDSRSVEKVAQLSMSIFWLVIPSLSLFITLPVFLRYKLNFYLSLFLATIIMITLYFILVFILKKFGITI